MQHINTNSDGLIHSELKIAYKFITFLNLQINNTNNNELKTLKGSIQKT